MSAVPVLLVSAREDVEAMLAADPGALATVVTRVPRIEDPMGAATRWKVVVLDAVTVPGAVDLGARIREASDKVEFIVVTDDPRVLVEAIRAGAYQAVSWPCDPAELWDPVAACVKRVAPPEAPSGVGEFRFKEKLASGGMGDVWLAESPRFESSVVVKLMQSEFASVPELSAMFRTEAAISARLAHPNIVRTLDHGEADGRLFLALEHIHGWDLLDVGRAIGWRFPEEIAFHVVAEIAAALDYAHSLTDERGEPLRIVHRDVNPPNILLSRDGRVLLSDFGIAKSVQSSTQTQAGVIKGKVEYFSPEQIAGEPVDARSDLFPLGAVLYLLLTGAHPFRGPSRNDTMKRVRWATYTPVSEVRPGLPEATERVVLRALARERVDRYQTAGEMERDLRRLAGGRVPQEDVAEFLSRALDERTWIAGARASRSVSISSERSGVRSYDTGEPTIGREGAAPGEATVVRTDEATVLRPPSEMHASQSELVPVEPTALTRDPRLPAVRASPALPAAAKWVGLATAAIAIVLLAFFAGAGGGGSAGTATRTPLAQRSATTRPITSPTPLAARTTALPITTPLEMRTVPPAATESATFPVPTTTERAPPASTTERATSPTATTAVARETPSPVATAIAAITRKPVGRGTLTIWMPSGWASIAVDGKPLGVNAPRVGIELPAGPHTVTLENPPAKFRQSYDVVITAGRELRLEASLP